MRVIHGIFPGLLTASWLVQPGWAGTLRGTVVEAGGQAPVIAQVLVVGASVFRTSTDRRGAFELELPSGTYTVTVTSDLPSSWALDGVVMRAGGDTELAVELAPHRSPLVFSFPEATPVELEKYRAILERFGEPPLCSGAGDAESYRLLWLRAFDNPILVHVFRTGSNEIRYEYKRLEGVEGEEGPLAEVDAGSVLERLRERGGANPDADLDRRAAEAMLGFAEEGFWRQPYAIEEPGMITVDGAAWIVEGRRATACHVVSRHSPGRNDLFRRFAQALLFELAGRRFYYDEVY